MTTDLSCVKTDLNHVSDAVSDLSGDLEEHSSQTSREIQSSLQSSTKQLMQLSINIDTLQSTRDTRGIPGFVSLNNCATSSVLRAHDSMSTQIKDDVSDIRNKIDDHDTLTAAKLMDIEYTFWLLYVWRHRRLETCSLPGHDRPQHQLPPSLE